MSKVKDPFKDLDLIGQDLGPIEEPEEESDDLSPSDDFNLYQGLEPDRTPLKLPSHLMRRSLDTECIEWSAIVSDPRDVIWLKMRDKTMAQSKRTRYYHARTYLMEVAKKQLDFDFKERIGGYTINVMKRNNSYYLQFVQCHLDEFELLDEPEPE